MRISLEAQAKLPIQELIRSGCFEWAASYMLTYENPRNRIETKKAAIGQFLKENAAVYAEDSHSKEAERTAEPIQANGVKSADSIHTACAIRTHCDDLIATDDRLMKDKDERISIADPTEFVRLIEGGAENG